MMSEIKGWAIAFVCFAAAAFLVGVYFTVFAHVSEGWQMVMLAPICHGLVCCLFYSGDNNGSFWELYFGMAGLVLGFIAAVATGGFALWSLWFVYGWIFGG